MKQRYLEVTFRNGKAIAAYLYLPREAGDTSERTEKRDGGLVIDFAADGRAIGIEITSPGELSINALNCALEDVNQEAASPDELAPLVAA